MISLQNLSIEFQAKPLFDNISCVVNRRDRVALVGRNGAGKTTLLRIISGLQLPTSGKIEMSSELTIGYLPQHMEVADSTTLVEEVGKAFAEIDSMEERLRHMTESLASRTDYESASYAELIESMTDLQEQLVIRRSVNHQAELERTLLGLGFVRADFNRPTAEFSGGWRMRIELAKLLLSHPDVLLLDEPTNHLDIESIQWLEQFLKTKAKAVIVVSHDRAFLDNVTTRTIEISLGKIYDYSVSYSKFVELRQQRIEQQTRAWQNQQKQIADTEDFIERFRYKATKAVQVQSRIKQLAKIERIEIDTVDNSRLNLRFPPAPRSGDFPLIVDNVGKAFGNHQVFDGAEFTIRRGEKVAFVGKNGQGKTTMVRCILKQLDHTGTIRIGHNVMVGYFAQNQASLLDGELTVFDTIDKVAVGPIRTKIRDILGAFMFGGDDIDKKVKVLSGGERTRLAMIRLLLQPVNMLILDEPTNHLDMASKDVLKQAIADFEGTVIVVSHDREFLDGLVEKVYEFSDGHVNECIGGIYEFLEKKRLNSLDELNLSISTTPQAKAEEQPEEKPDSGRMSYAERREREKVLRKLRKRVEEAEADVERREAEVASIEAKMAEGQYDAALFEQHSAAKKASEMAMSVWELAVTELETAESGQN